ncbi:MAG TPA: fumarylacetoacetate hydrolase family protein [Candidatus Dormibacteraeota bacterium]|nr:fumarylacetoacetate hydrolase family protein [Candidatus Dormibacteraeota bacterium]
MLNVRPTKIVAVGRNYAAHARELGSEVPAEPLLFLKPPSSIVWSGADVVYPPQTTNLQYEAELAVVIGGRCRNVADADALLYVRGFTCANDVTARDLQQGDAQWTRGKGFDTFCPLGPRIVAGIDPSHLRVTMRLNGETRQDGNTADMIFPVARLISYISAVMTLEPEDVILTGTPHGVGPVQRGDLMEVEVEGIGILSNRVS